MRFRILAGFLCATVGASLTLSAVEMDFEGLTGSGEVPRSAPYTEDGFVLTTDFENTGTLPGVEKFLSVHDGSGFYAGSVSFITNYTDDFPILTRAGGGTFDLVSIDLDSLYLGQANIQFIGVYESGGTVTQSFFTDDTRNSMETFTLAGFNDLVSVSWDDLETATLHHFDNIVVEARQDVNLLPNPNFDTGIESWGALSDAVLSWASGMDVDGNPASGSMLIMQVQDDPDGAIAESECIAVNDDTEFSFGGWFHIDGAQAGEPLVQMTLWLYDGPNCTGSSLTSPGTNNSAQTDVWFEKSSTRVLEEGAVSARLRINVSNYSNEPFAVHADAMYVLGPKDDTTTERASINSMEEEGNGSSYAGAASWSITDDGRVVVFHSFATNLVDNDTNGMRDVFARDRLQGVTTRVSVNSLGVQGDGESGYGAVSADGRFVAFWSASTNLVDDDTNGFADYFIHDLESGVTSIVSVDSLGNQANASPNNRAVISADGRYVAFPSPASNLVANDTNGSSDVFVHDRQSGTTTRVSTNSSGDEGNGWSDLPVISSDGRYIAFYSDADNLVSGDTNGSFDAFVHDRDTGNTSRVSVDSNGNEGNGDSAAASISEDGQLISFYSHADNLESGDTNGCRDVFVHDRQTGITSRVSVNSSGAEGDAASVGGSMSANGRFVAFSSDATNLVGVDTNGFSDAFVRDRQTGVTTRISIDLAGLGGGDNDSYGGSVSADGRFVAFWSFATNLVGDDTNGAPDVFVFGPSFGLLFSDDFESGDTTAWSETNP